MDNNNLYMIKDKIKSDTDAPSAAELEALLDKELSKPENEIDFALVDELTLSIIELDGNAPIENDTDEKLKELYKLNASEKKRFTVPKWAIALSAACLILFFGNIFTVSAWDMNVFRFIVNITKGGAIIDFGNIESNGVIYTDESDPYGVIAKCAEMGISVEIPRYIPEGFEMTNMEYDDYDRKYIGTVCKSGEQLISVTIESYEDMLYGIPSDRHNLTEFEICGHPAVMSREDNQMITVFRSGEYLVTVMTKNIDYGECDKIINSIE